MAARMKSRTVEPGISRVKLPSGAEAFRVQVSGRKVGGKRHSKLVATYEQARAIKAAWLAGGGPAPGAEDLPAADPGQATVDDGWRAYVLSLATPRPNDGGPHQAEERAARAQQVKDAVRALCRDLADKPIAGVVAEDIRSFVAARRAPGGNIRGALERPGLRRHRPRAVAGCSPATIERDLRAFRAMLKKARPDFAFPVDVWPPEDLTRTRHLRPDEEAALYDDLALSAGPRFARLARLCLLAVCRQQDIRRLRRDQIRLAEHCLVLPGLGRKAKRVTVKPLSPEAQAIVEAQLSDIPADLDFVFGDPRTGQPYSRVHLTRVFRRSAHKIGRPDFHFHDQRHHGPTVAMNAGASLEVLKTLLDVTSEKMVRRYAQVLEPTARHYLDLIADHGSPA